MSEQELLGLASILFVGVLFLSASMTAWSLDRGNRLSIAFWTLMTVIAAAVVGAGVLTVVA